MALHPTYIKTRHSTRDDFLAIEDLLSSFDVLSYDETALPHRDFLGYEENIERLQHDPVARASFLRRSASTSAELPDGEFMLLIASYIVSSPVRLFGALRTEQETCDRISLLRETVQQSRPIDIGRATGQSILDSEWTYSRISKKMIDLMDLTVANTLRSRLTERRMRKKFPDLPSDVSYGIIVGSLHTPEKVYDAPVVEPLVVPLTDLSPADQLIKCLSKRDESVVSLVARSFVGRLLMTPYSGQGSTRITRDIFESLKVLDCDFADLDDFATSLRQATSRSRFSDLATPVASFLRAHGVESVGDLAIGDFVTESMRLMRAIE